MRLTSSRALELLEDSKGRAENDGWIEHCLCVGDTAGIIAKELGIDDDKARAMGYVHDIGKRFGYTGPVHHSITGYEYLLSVGIDDEYARVCLTHSFLNNDVDCEGVGIFDKNMDKYDFLSNYIKTHEYDDYDNLIILCDLLCTKQVIGLEKRLIDISLRYGVYPNTAYYFNETLKLKEYFDKKLGYDLYKLFADDILYNKYFIFKR